MNFEKLISKNKNNLWIILVVVLFLYFLTIPNKVNFLYRTPLGRAYLIALLILVASYNCYLGLLTVVLVALIHNSTDTVFENFQEGADSEDKDDDKEEKKEDSSVSGALLGKFGLKKEEKKEEKDEEKKESFSILGRKIELGGLMRKPVQSKQTTVNKDAFSLKGGNPAPAFPGKEAFEGLGFSEFK
jgi:hypothetical protein